MNNVLVKNGHIRHDFITGKNKSPYISGRSFLEAGYIYAPYIPITIESIIHDPNDFQPTESVMSRYTTTTVNNRFYSTITVSDFDSLGND